MTQKIIGAEPLGYGRGWRVQFDDMSIATISDDDPRIPAAEDRWMAYCDVIEPAIA